jgi:monomeric sarcosine oxidase
MQAGKTYDVAVIGAGVFGAWTAYRLCRAGVSVALIDSYGPANARASSGGESRIIRMGYGADEIYTRWSMQSLPMWKQLFVDAHRPELFRQTGVLWIAPAGYPYALDSLAAMNTLGIPAEKLSVADLVVRYPQIDFEDDAWGVLEPQSGVLLARRAVHAVVERAEKLGVDFTVGEVKPPQAERRLSDLTTTNGDRISAGTYVFACGPWLGKVFPHLLASRIFPSRAEIFFFGVPAGSTQFREGTLPTWLYLKDEFYGMPDIEGRGFKVADDRHGATVDPDTQSRLASAETLTAARAFLARRFPALASAPVIESRVCQYENTSNGDFLIDRHPEIENVWLVGGGSGHGFKHGPALGEYVSARVLGDPQRHSPIEPRFSLATKLSQQNRAVH